MFQLKFNGRAIYRDVGRNNKTSKGWGSVQTLSATRSHYYPQGQRRGELSPRKRSQATGRRYCRTNKLTEPGHRRKWVQGGEWRLNILPSSSSSFLFMLCLLGQIQLEAKGLKNQVMHSMQIRIPGQRPGEQKAGECVVGMGEWGG